MNSVYMCGCTDTFACPEHPERATSCLIRQYQLRATEMRREITRGLSREKNLLIVIEGYCTPEARKEFISDSKEAIKVILP